MVYRNAAWNESDWGQNPFMVEFAKNVYNLNAHQLASVQRVHDRNCTASSSSAHSFHCFNTPCASYKDAFGLATLPIQWNPLDRTTDGCEVLDPDNNPLGGWCTGSHVGCVVYPEMAVAVPYIPCIPDTGHICIEPSSIDWCSFVLSLPMLSLPTGTCKGDFANESSNAAADAAVISLLSLDNYTIAVRGWDPVGNVWSKAPGVEVRLPIRIPSKDGQKRDYLDPYPPPTNISGYPEPIPRDFAGAFVPDAFGKKYFCEDIPGPNGHHCYKLVHGPEGDKPKPYPYHPPNITYNESLATVAHETGTTWQALCAEYNLTNCSFVSVITGVAIPNSPSSPTPPPTPAGSTGFYCDFASNSCKPGGPYHSIQECNAQCTTSPTPAPPTPAAGGQCTGCIGGSKGECKAPSSVCFPATAGACPAGTTHC
jgi:hypothetical protein